MTYTLTVAGVPAPEPPIVHAAAIFRCADRDHAGKLVAVVKDEPLPEGLSTYYRFTTPDFTEWYVAVIATLPENAYDGLRVLGARLEALGATEVPEGDELDALASPLVFRHVRTTIANVAAGRRQSHVHFAEGAALDESGRYHLRRNQG